MAQQLFDLLKRDHRQVEKWMTQIMEGGESERERIFDMLQDALEKHMHMEEKLFYPEVKKLKPLKELAADALEEHEKARGLLSELEELDINDKEWLNTFSEMRDGILHHVEDEEKKIFPGCKEHMQAQLLREIGEKMTAMKEGSHKKTK